MVVVVSSILDRKWNTKWCSCLSTATETRPYTEQNRQSISELSTEVRFTNITIRYLELHLKSPDILCKFCIFFFNSKPKRNDKNKDLKCYGRNLRDGFWDVHLKKLHITFRFVISFFFSFCNWISSSFSSLLFFILLKLQCN